MALRNASIERDYQLTLDQLVLLATQDLLDWWADNDDLSFVDKRRMVQEPFSEIVRVYGEEASSAAVDYIIAQRSLDDELYRLQFPKLADPVAYEQAAIAARAATYVPDAKMMSSIDPLVVGQVNQVALNNLQKSLSRLVLFQSRETVFQATKDAGTAYARIPEIGACTFCLMLASRGAVYTKETVTVASSRSMRGYHDGCRCLGVEIRDDSELPQINRDLEKAYREKTGPFAPKEDKDAD